MDIIIPIEITTIVVGCATCAAAGAVAGLWKTLLRIKNEDEAQRDDRCFSYYDAMDAAAGAAWGGAVGGLMALTAPVSVPYYLWLRSERESENRGTSEETLFGE
ncbi:hypothetical protein [Medusavirus stheno T3]|uniref:Uncharacterized protein n=1 Tax=Medusavirus stheno T3 TaxID=3069717 RepID=A0A7S7YEZ4_9VIRU|nr:hypothetical protein QKU73_gp194 [Acanthamoeba castellanii medusavirus]QPB44581.1 hypothetical protein [Medusavirus stheno T3]